MDGGSLKSGVMVHRKFQTMPWRIHLAYLRDLPLWWELVLAVMAIAKKHRVSSPV